MKEPERTTPATHRYFMHSPQCLRDLDYALTAYPVAPRTFQPNSWKSET